jgi:head-tail adaptor
MDYRNTGNMRHRAKLYQRGRTDDNIGGGQRTDQLIDERWCSIDNASRGEVFQYGKLEQIVTHKLVMRYDNNYIKQGNLLVLPSEIAQVPDRLFYIIDVVDINERKEFVTVMVREGGNK